jgi:hypothetical protein
MSKRKGHGPRDESPESQEPPSAPREPVFLSDIAESIVLRSDPDPDVEDDPEGA